MDILEKYVDKKSRTLRMKDNDIVEVVFVTAEEVPNRFGEEGDTTMKYSFEFKGETKYLFSQSVAFAAAMMDVEPGAPLKIQRLGTGSQTKYVLLSLKGKEEIEDEPAEGEPKSKGGRKKDD